MSEPSSGENTSKRERGTSLYWFPVEEEHGGVREGEGCGVVVSGDEVEG